MVWGCLYGLNYLHLSDLFCSCLKLVVVALLLTSMVYRDHVGMVS